MKNSFNLKITSFWGIPLTGLLLISCYFSPACRAEDVGKGSDPEFVKAIDDALRIPLLQTGFQGVIIASLKDNSILYERNADKVFLPASNNKLLTSGAALALLGPDFIYQTSLVTEAQLSAGGNLSGDLIIKGSGSPILNLEDLDALAKQAKAAGVVRVKGHFAFDDSRFDRNWLGNDWASDDEPFYYAAQISGLNVNHNVIKVTVSPGEKEGDPVKVGIAPAFSLMTIRNLALTGKKKSENSITLDRVRGQNIIVVSGFLPVDTTEAKLPSETLTIESPARFTATLMRDALKKTGVKFDNDEIISLVSPEDPIILAEHTSVPLSEILKLMNKPSDNLIAECLLKTIGAVKKKKGSWDTGISVTKEWFESIGLDTTHLRQADGSGLSRFNYVSPRNYLKLLTWYSSQTNFAYYYNSLAIAGVDGTLVQFAKNTPAAGNCRAKDGYIGNVSSLTGYVKNSEGENFVFSILMNNHLTNNATCRTVQSKIVNLIASYKREN